MAVPQAKDIAGRGATSAARSTRSPSPRLQICPNCKQPKRTHRVCPNCKTYSGPRRRAARASKRRRYSAHDPRRRRRARRRPRARRGRRRARSSVASTGSSRSSSVPQVSSTHGLTLVETSEADRDGTTSPVESVRAKPDSSLVRAVQAVADGDADVVVVRREHGRDARGVAPPHPAAARRPPAGDRAS